MRLLRILSFVTIGTVKRHFFIGVNEIKFICVLRNCDILDVNIQEGEF